MGSFSKQWWIFAEITTYVYRIQLHSMFQQLVGAFFSEWSLQSVCALDPALSYLTVRPVLQETEVSDCAAS